ncbi:MAG: hypothetical protein WD872_07885 [Pirellulaceae bacterium]
MDRRLIIALLLAGLSATACRPSAAPGIATPEGRDALAALPGARASPHSGLQAELALVESQQALPLHLAAPAAGAGPAGDSAAAIQELAQAFPPLTRRQVTTSLAEVYDGGPLALSPIQLERGRDLLRKHAAAIDKFRAALPGEPGGFGPRLCDGILADLSFLDPLQIGCRLEAVAAAIAIAEHRPDDALPHLERMLVAARWLSAEPNLTARLAAASLRSDALDTLAAIAGQHHATRKTHEQLFRLLSENTADWPDDALAWIGDRAAGLLIYELVRDGQYLSLLSAAEIKQLEDQQVLRVTATAVMRNIDDDQHYYLQTTRQLIDACEQTYWQRQESLACIRRELSAKEQSSDYPLVAANLLLVDFEHGHRRQAQDFARTLAWMLALGSALGRETPSVPTNPLTGEPYRVERTPLAVTVSDVLPGRDEPCIVPVLPVQQARR